MKTHVLNTFAYTIRTRTEVLCTVTGIGDALDAVTALESIAGVAVFFDGNEGMSAKLFIPWAKHLTKLINNK